MERARTKILGTIGLLLIAAFVFGIAFALMPSSSNVAEAYESYFSTDGDQWEEGVFTEYSTGIYWYASGETIPKRTNPVDKSKPTLIFAHGLKYKEGYKERDLLSLWFDTNRLFTSKGYSEFELEDEYYQLLIDEGYNVGQFYWSQLSDDSLDCDKKIWSSKSAMGMRYVVNDGNGNRVQGDASKNPTKSVAMIFGDAVKASLGNDYAKDLHLVGHSMGGQLVLATGEYLAKQQEKGTFGDHLVPNQVSLIDPYFGMTMIGENEDFSIDHLDGVMARKNSMLAELAAHAMETLARHNVAIDAYGGQETIYRLYTAMSPSMFVKEKNGDELAERFNEELTDKLSRYVAWTYLDSLASKYGFESHCMIIDYYFSTLSEPMIAKDNYGREVPSARATKEYLLNLRGKAFVQSLAEDKAGQNPFYMHNSSYTRTNAEYEAVSDDFTAYVEPPVINPPAEEKNDILHNKDFIIGMSVGAGTLAIVIAVVVIYFVTKKKLKQ